MCFLFLWNTLCLDNYIPDILSQKIEIGAFPVCPISFKILLSQAAWKAAMVAATYYSSAEDMLTNVLFLRCPRDHICTQMERIN